MTYLCDLNKDVFAISLGKLASFKELICYILRIDMTVLESGKKIHDGRLNDKEKDVGANDKY